MNTRRWRKRIQATCTFLGIIMASVDPALANTGVIAWGSNNNGETNVPAGLTNAVAIAAGVRLSLGLQADGRVLAWGSFVGGATNVPTDLTNAVDVSAGQSRCLALRADGTIARWGSPTNIPASVTNVAAVAAGPGYYDVALKSNGTLVVWNSSSGNVERTVEGLTNAVAVAAGHYHQLALTDEGRVLLWSNYGGIHTIIPSGLSNVVAIEAGFDCSVALTGDGRVVGWPSDNSVVASIPPDSTNIVAISVFSSRLLTLSQDGVIRQCYPSGQAPTNVHAIGIASGPTHWLAITNDGSPHIAWQPRHRTVFAGFDATVGAGIVGAPPVNYQWVLDDSIVPNATNMLLELHNVQPTNAGNYRLTASNVYGAVTSSVAVLTVIADPPTVSIQPPNPIGLLTSNVTLTVSAAGPLPITYQWRFNGTDISDATNTFLTLSDLQLSDEGIYTVVASNPFGSTTSSNAFLNVIDLPESLNATNLVWTTYGSQTWQPQTNVTHDGVAAAGSGRLISSQKAYLETTFYGPGTLTYWWRYQGTLGGGSVAFYVDGTNQASLSSVNGWQVVTNYLTAANHTVTWKAGLTYEFTSDVVTGYLDQVTYTPGPTAAFFLTQPSDRNVPAGTNVTFTITAGGTPPYSYQWYFNNGQIPGATGPALTLVNIQAADAGFYRVAVSNAYGGAFSSNATLVVNASAPVIWTNPVSQCMVPGGQVTFSILARGTDPLSYQWQHSGLDIADATNASLTLSRVGTNDQGAYRAVVNNVHGQVISSNATLSLVPTVLVGWGDNLFGQVNCPNHLTNVSAFGAGWDNSFAANRGGPVTNWGFPEDAFPSNLTNIVALDGGGFQAIALCGDGSVAAVGSFLGTVPTLTNAVAVGAGSTYCVALTADGRTVAWSGTSSNPTNVPPDLTNTVAIAAGDRHCLAVKSDGTVKAWGSNSYGQTNVPGALSNVVAVAGGVGHSLALKADGRVVAWGYGYFGQTNVPTDLSSIVAVAAGDYYSAALRNNGTVAVWGRGNNGETNVPAWLTNVVAIAAGDTHVLALLNDGSPYLVRHPWNQTVFTGSTATFNVAVMGAGRFHTSGSSTALTSPGPIAPL